MSGSDEGAKCGYPWQPALRSQKSELDKKFTFEVALKPEKSLVEVRACDLALPNLVCDTVRDMQNVQQAFVPVIETG